MTRTEVLELSEVQAMLGAINTRYPTGARNHALLSFMLATGLRCNEALQVVWEDLLEESWRGGRRWVLHVRRETTKGGRVRQPTPLTEAAMRSLERWRRERARLRIRGGPLFCTLSRGQATGYGEGGKLKAGRPLSSAYVRAMVKRVAKDAGIVRRVHPHMLRHTALTALWDQTHNLRLVQDVAGHSSSRHTERYTHVHPEEVAEAMDAIAAWWEGGEAEGEEGRGRG